MKEITKKTSQYIDNLEHDESLEVKKVMPYGWTGSAAVAVAVDASGNLNVASPALASKATISGGYAYVCEAAAGSSLASAVWKISRTSLTDPFLTTYADGNTNFDNVASNPSSLTYS